MSIRHAWRPLHDAECEKAFTVSPLTGHLIATADASGFDIPTLALRCIGLTPATKVAANSFWDINSPSDGVISGADITRYKRLKRSIHCVTEAVSRACPLGLAVRLIDRYFTPKYADVMSIGEAVDIASRLFGRRSRGDCLLMSLKRYSLLRSLGQTPSISIGVFVPTEEMHAWVEVQGVPVLECPDILVHYAKAVTFYRTTV